MESLPTLGIATHEFGINLASSNLQTGINKGYKQERPDQWLGQNSPRYMEQSSEIYAHRCMSASKVEGTNPATTTPIWVDCGVIVGIPHDVPVAGFGGNTVNSLDLCSTRVRSADYQRWGLYPSGTAHDRDGDNFRGAVSIGCCGCQQGTSFETKRRQCQRPPGHDALARAGTRTERRTCATDRLRRKGNGSMFRLSERATKHPGHFDARVRFYRSPQNSIRRVFTGHDIVADELDANILCGAKNSAGRVER